VIVVFRVSLNISTEIKFFTMIYSGLFIASVLFAVVSFSTAEQVPLPSTILEGKTFPADFKFGVSTSSYQVEGGWLDGGKGLSIWDAYSHIPGRISNGDTGDIANDMYHLYPQDVELMEKMGVKHYRFSIAWNRILPTGVAPVNQEGIDYYNDLINKLLEHNIEPHVTIYHSETPLALTLYPNNPMPFLDSTNFPTWFADYSKVLFDSFGDRVKHWFTFNEPFCTAVFGTYGDSDPYMIGHNAILAHASVYRLYETSYKNKQSGTVGIVLNTAHFYPLNKDSKEDNEAAQRGYDFWYGWFLDPLTKGSYPTSMQKIVGNRLPTFTEEQKKMIIGALDFVAINYYFPYLTSPGTIPTSDPPSFFKDMNITTGFGDWPLSQTGNLFFVFHVCFS
jgi:beta-glucosidase/6-phospho-beta-glucosidase/beta-galactosidase